MYINRCLLTVYVISKVFGTDLSMSQPVWVPVKTSIAWISRRGVNSAYPRGVTIHTPWWHATRWRQRPCLIMTNAYKCNNEIHYVGITLKYINVAYVSFYKLKVTNYYFYYFNISLHINRNRCCTWLVHAYYSHSIFLQWTRLIKQQSSNMI